MTAFLNILWRIWMIIIGLVFTITIGLPVYLLSFRKSHYRYCYFFIRLWAYCMYYGMGMRYKRINLSKQKIDKHQQYVFVSNHTSIMDIMLMLILVPKHPLCFVGKKELVKIPIFGTIYKRVCVMVDRNSARSRADVYRRCAEKMQEGCSIVIFPEGGVPDDTSIILDDFKDGAFILATKHNFSIASFTFVGLKEMFPFNNKKGHPGCAKAYFNGIYEPDLSMSELKSAVYKDIKNVLNEYYIINK
ncbi:lysophospholipid acyltransferase family protein [Soonwooa sp.]|uniref:lysophospholipid acyltransferase family protein n=1 Tax=Soonwooa sp. TaxID=1938592 RepID=UPI00261265A4|nr:lysophospholipid acyltransferase family protein [Soonwooa sp.]